MQIFEEKSTIRTTSKTITGCTPQYACGKLYVGCIVYRKGRRIAKMAKL
nr:MAG TPA: hypothetical protein [Caudoviricetes sp.]